MIYVYFSFSGDSDILALSVEQLRRADPNATIWVANDAAAPAAVPAGCKEIRTRYPRGEHGTGNGLPAVQGELEVFRYILEQEKATHLVKVDSDVWVRDVSLIRPGFTVQEGLPEPDFVACEGSRALLPMGCFYRISKWAVQYALAYIARRNTMNAWQHGTYAEALTLWHILSLSRLHLHLIPGAIGYLTGVTLQGSYPAEAVARAAILHCGEPYREGGNLIRAPRELTLTRMLLIQNLHT